MRAHHHFGLLYANTPCMYQKPDAALLPFTRTKGDKDTGSELDPADGSALSNCMGVKRP